MKETKTSPCPKCGKEVDNRGKRSHEMACKGTLQNSSVQTEAKAEPKAAPAQEKIVVQQEYAEVPKLPTQIEAAPVIEPPKAEPKTEVPAEQPQADDRGEVDLSGLPDMVLSFFDGVFKKNNIKMLGDEEKESFRTSGKAVIKKYLPLYFKHAEIVNFGLCTVFIFGSRWSEIQEAKARNAAEDAAKKTEQTPPPAPTPTAPPKIETDAERTAREFEEISRGK